MKPNAPYPNPGDRMCQEFKKLRANESAQRAVADAYKFLTKGRNK